MLITRTKRDWFSSIKVVRSRDSYYHYINNLLLNQKNDNRVSIDIPANYAQECKNSFAFAGLSTAQTDKLTNE